MKQIKQKLHSRRGASLLLAMVIFMVAAMVSVVIVAVATTAVKRVHDDQRQHQEYLTLQSAAGLMENCMEGSSCTITDIPRQAEPEYAAGSGLLGKKMSDAVYYLETFFDGSNPIQSNPITVTVTPDKQDGDTIMEPSELTFTLTKTADAENLYQVQGTLELTGDGSRLLMLSAQLVGSAHTEPYTWEEPRYDGDGNPVLDEDDNPITDTKTGAKTITEIQWQNIEFKAFEALTGGGA